MRFDKAMGLVLCAICAPAIQGCVGVIAVGAVAGATATQDRRTPGSYIDDELIEIKVFAAISEDKNLWDQSHINATSFNGIVLLTGETPGQSLRDRVTEITRNITKVRSVENQITLEAPSSFLSRSKDALITANVKAVLFKTEQFDASHVKVITEKGAVYLMGLLRQDEAERMVEIARRASGVKHVFKLFEYIE